MGLAARKLRMTASAAGGAFSPDDIASLVGWWDASDATTFSYSSGSLVSEWRSKVGSFALTQATVSKQPSRSATINGVDAVDFDGDADELGLAAPVVSAPLTWYAVATKPGTGGNSVSVLVYVDGRSSYTAANASFGTWSGSTTRTWTTTTTDWTTASVFSQSRSTTQVDGEIDGVSKLATTGYTDASDAGLWIGSENGWQYGNWTVGAVLLFDEQLSSGNRDDVDAYLANQWGT